VPCVTLLARLCLTNDLTQLPDDALDYVVSLAARDADDALKISLACRRLKQVTSSSSAWKNIVDRGWSERCDIVMPALERAANQSWMQVYRERMSSYLPHAAYLRRHVTLTVKKRSILVNWMLGVSYEFGSSSDTILQHTAVALLDSYLNVRTVPISQTEFQCVGAACLVKALQDVCQLDCIKVAMSCVLAAWYTKDVCSAEDIIATVQHITSTLPPHRESAPIHAVITRLLRSMHKAASGSRTFCLTHYLGELALQSEAMLMFTHEAIACACFAVACNCLGWAEPVFMEIINKVCMPPSPLHSLVAASRFTRFAGVCVRNIQHAAFCWGYALHMAPFSKSLAGASICCNFYNEQPYLTQRAAACSVASCIAPCAECSPQIHAAELAAGVLPCRSRKPVNMMLLTVAKLWHRLFLLLLLLLYPASSSTVPARLTQHKKINPETKSVNSNHQTPYHQPQTINSAP